MFKTAFKTFVPAAHTFVKPSFIIAPIFSYKNSPSERGLPVQLDE